MKKLFKWSLIVTTLVLLLVLFSFSASAETSSYYTYSVSNGEVTITDVDDAISGDVVIPSTLGGYPVTSIGDSAFRSCDGLTSITIPDSVTSIGDFAFCGCDSLTSITIPDSVTSIGNHAFEYCDSLTSITVDNENKYYSSDERGVLFNKDKTELIQYPAGNKAQEYIIPDSVTSIGNFAFCFCDSLTNVTIGNGVKSIGYFAFFCSSLTNVTIGNGVTSIGEDAFFECSSLETVTFNATNIPSYAFNDCAGLTNVTIGNGVTSIGDSAFSGCRSLTSITIPDSVTSIGDSAFYDCDGLETVYYLDTVAQKKNINIFSSNGNLTSATWYYESCIGTVEHTYDNNCDTMCNVCSYVRTAPHVCDNACDTTCNICGATRKVGAHKYSNSCDTTCDYCNAKRTIKHTYSNNCDTSCNVCKATRTITHTYKTTTTKATLSKNGSVIKKCTVCDNVASKTTIKYAKTFKLSTTAYTYDGKVKTPTVTVKDSAGKILKENVDYTVTYDSGRKNAGNYQVTIKMKGNYTGTKTLTFVINPIDSDTCDIKLSSHTYTYNGKVQKPTVTVKNANGTTLKEDKHYTVTYQKGRKNAGTYKVTVKMKGNYSGTKTLNFKIKPISISKCEIALSKTNYTYDGKSKIPSVTVLNHKGTKLTDSSYTVTYASGRKNVGAYKVTIKMKGNYTGTKTLTFKINPVKTKVSKLTTGKKSITVAITKKSTQVTGYQIQYSTSKKFTNAKTKTISSYKTTKYTLKSLSAKKTYYVRVRTYKTVGKTKYYSGWSTYKYVKTK